ncbi:MAG: prolyl oligopeptidase family serine peptidase [Gemmataceae bacterium]
MRLVPALLFALLLVPDAPAAPEFTRTRDVIYGRKFGLALTMDVMTPKKANGLGVVFVVSGGWFSRPEAINPAFVASMLARGYTVFNVVHGSQPKFTILEIADDLHRAIRYIKHHAKDYKVEADRLGIMGASAGGHLSLLMGTTGGPGDPKAADPIDRLSSKVAAVGCFFPPTDFLNYGAKGNELIDRQFQPPFTAAMDWHEFDRKKALFLPVKDKEKLRAIAKKVSPAWQVTKASAPSLLIHGDKDKLVPIQQAEVYCERCKEAGVAHKLEVRKDADHGWATLLLDVELIGEWFDEHLANKKPAE